MTLRDYFANADGAGILSTADENGHVNAALYSKPHIMDDGTIAFVMRERLTHHYLQSNSFACYLFLENSPGYQGIRLHLKKVKEQGDPDIIEPFMKRYLTLEEDRKRGPKYLVSFTVEKILPLSGSGTAGADRVV